MVFGIRQSSRDFNHSPPGAHIRFHIHNIYGFVVSCIQGTLGFFDRLHGVEIGYGVDELVDLLDLQVSVFVGNDLCNGERFVVQINPECGLCLLGELISR